MPTATPLRVIQISDIHLTSQPGSQVWGVDVDAGLSAVLEQIRLENPAPDFVLATGDLVGDDPAAYPRLRQFLETLDVPVYCLPGNHDFPAELSRIMDEGRVRRERYLAVGGWQFVLLDSSFPGAPEGHLAYGELALLDSVLATEPALPTVVCLHHNPVSVRTPWLDGMTIGNSAALFAVLDRYPQVRAVTWGHIHSEFAAERNAVRLLSAPATCVQFKLNTPQPNVDDLPPGYRWFAFYPDGTLETGVKRVKPLVRPHSPVQRVSA